MPKSKSGIIQLPVKNQSRAALTELPKMFDHIRVTRYQSSDRSRIFEFLRTVYPKARAERMVAQWDWKYDANPFNREPSPYVLLLKDGDKITGMMGAIPLRVSIHGSERWVTNSCDAIVHPDYRGHRIARKMVQRYMDDNPIGFGWANPLSNRIWRDTPNVSSGRIVPLIGPTMCAKFRIGANRGIDIAPVEKFDSRFDTLWQQVHDNYAVIFTRDQRYLRWRFDSRPDAKYTRLCAFRSADLLGYVVLRLVEKRNMRVAYLVDWLVKDKNYNVLALLVQHSLVWAQHERAGFLIARTAMLSLRRMFYRLGFIPWYWGVSEHLIIRVDLLDPNLQIFHNTRAWHLTMGDGDMETFY